MGDAPSAFDAAYFNRYYESKRTRVYGPQKVAHLARGLTGLIRWFGGSLDSVLDVGAGTGLFRDWFVRHEKPSRYLSIDVSEYACATYGHERRDIASWCGKERFDLIVCHGVLPYLDDAAVARAADHMAKMAGGFLYVEAVTKLDFETAIDSGRTDLAMRARSGAFYRRVLGKGFEPLGCGLWYAKRARCLPFYELERCPAPRKRS